jgi:FAD:protein FMN transferase
MMRAMSSGQRALSLPLLLVVALLLVGCDRAPTEYRFDGRTMGTGYHVVAYCAGPVRDVEQRVAALLRDVNDHLSTFQPDSVLSRFNESPVGEWINVTGPVAEVVDAALALSRASDGAFDVTVGPLVNLWGFGPDGQPEQVPSPETVAAAQERVGYQHLELRTEPPALRKQRDLYVDLSAIAKGWGVDLVIEQLAAWGCPSSLVEIGGDLRAGEHKPDGSAWRVGVEVPDPNAQALLQRTLAVSEVSVATSGDYRNFADWGDEHAHHIIDPRSGRAASSALKSVTVVHPSAMWADGYATLLHVLGAENAYAFALDNELPVMLIVQTDDGFEEHVTPQLEPFLTQR